MDIVIKKLKRYILYISVAVIFSIASFVIFFMSDYGKNRIISFTNKYIPVRIEFKDFSLNIFKGRIEIYDLVIYDDSDVIIGKIKKIALSIQYKPLFSGKYVADHLIIIEPSIDVSSTQISQIKKKIKNKDKITEDNIDKKTPDLVVNKLEILNTVLMYKDTERSSEYGFKTKKIIATVDNKNSDYSLNTVNSRISIKTDKINKTIINDSLNISLKDSDLNIKKARFRTEGLDISFIGLVNDLFTLPVLDIDLVAEVDNSKLFDRSEMFSKDSGKFSITGSINGEANYPELEISLKHPEGIIYGQQVNSLDLNAHYINKILSLKTDLLKGKNEKFNISVILDLTSVFEKGLVSSEPKLENMEYDLNIIADKFSLNNIPDMPDIKLDCSLELKGKGIKTDDIKANVALNTSLSPFNFKEFRLKKKATIKANINWDKGTFVSFADIKAGLCEWKNYKFSLVDISGTINDKGSVDIKHFELKMDNSSLALKGRSVIFDRNWKILKDPKIDVELEGKNISSIMFYPEIDTKVNCTVKAKGKLSSLFGDFDILTEKINYSGIEIENVSMNGRFENKDIVFNKINIIVAGGKISAEGKISEFTNFESKIKTQGLKIASLYPDIEKYITGGYIDLSIEAGGDFKNPKVSGNVLLREAFYGDEILPDIKLGIEMDSLIADLIIDLGFIINARTDLQKRDYSFVTRFNNWDFSYLIPENMNELLTGYICGDINGSGNFDNIQDYALIANIDSLTIKMDKKRIIFGSDLVASMSQEKLKLNKFDLKLLDDGFINAEGYLNFKKDLALNLKMQVPVSSLAFLEKELLDTDGNINGNLDLTGSMDDMKFSGALHLDKLGFYLPVTEQKIYDLNGDFIFDARTVNFNDVSGKIDNGSFDLNGSFDINNKLIENINITAKTTLLPISYPDHFDGAVNLDLSYAGNLSTGKLNGNIIVEDALYFKDFDPFGNIFSGQNKKTITVSSEKKQLPNISLNLTLRSRRTLVLDNNFAFLELKPDLDITGNLNSPLISGRTKIEKDGFIVFQKNTFAINKGILDFNPIYGMLPTVDIQSETKVNDHRIFLSVSENLSNPKFSLTSIPTESDADILSILLFGRKADEFVSGTNGVAVTKEKLVADWLYNTYQKDIAKKTGLDQIELTVPNNFSATKPQGYGLTVGKNISDRLVLKYSVVNNSSEFVQKGIADYKLLENIVFSGFQSTDNQFGAEIKYRLEFR